MKKLNVLVIVSSDVSDLYFANQLLKHLNVTGVIIDEQDPHFSTLQKLTRRLKLALNPVLFVKKLLSRSKEKNRRKNSPEFIHSPVVNAEQFGDEGQRVFPTESATITSIPFEESINDAVYVDKIRALNPDIIAVCGGPILNQKIMQIPRFGILNQHSGLSQKYRGLWTTEWAIYNNEPEYIGITIHYIHSGIDDGDIVAQGRPNLSPGDNPKLIYTKVVKLGINMMIRAIEDIEKGNITKHPLDTKGKLYLQNMVTREMREFIWKNVDDVLTTYLQDKQNRDIKVLDIIKGNH